MSCLTIADLLAAQFVIVEIDGVTVTVSYYPQVLTGYETSTQLRDPSEATAVEVSGEWADESETLADSALSRTATFTFTYSSDLGFTPRAGDGLTYDGMKYRVSKWDKASTIAGTSYTVTLASEGTV